MKVYQAVYNNGEDYEDNYDWNGGVYTSLEKCKKEVLFNLDMPVETQLTQLEIELGVVAGFKETGREYADSCKFAYIYELELRGRFVEE